MLTHAWSMATDPLGFLEQTFDRLGDVVELPMPRRPVLLMNDPEGVDHVLRAAHRRYGKRTAQYDALALVTGNGLLTTDDDEAWLVHRRASQPAYRATQSLAATTATVLGAVTAGWVPGEVVDVEAAMSHVSLEVVTRTLLGAAAGEVASLVRAVAVALDRVIARARNPLAPALGVPTPGNLRLRAAIRRLDEEAARLVASSGDAGLVPRLREAGLDERAVRDEVVTTLVAGHETVASSLTWALFLLARHPDVLTRVADETDRLPPDCLTPDQLPWTRQVVDEALRLYPPAWVISRRARVDDEVCGTPVGAGTLVVVSPWALHRRSAAWVRPEQFRPQRFDAVPARGTYLPFGAGPRLCIGRELALVESTVVLAGIARHWVLEPVSAADPRPRASVTVHPKGGLRLRVSPR